MPDALPIVVGLAGVAWAYRRGLVRLWERAGSGRGTHRWQAACFFAGLVSLSAALATPLEQLADEWLWAHMVQHVALIAVAAPLLVLGNPMTTLSWALPDDVRSSVSSFARHLSRGHATHYASWAALVLGAHTAALWLWHVPGPYEAAVRSGPLHALEHASLFYTALAFWWVVAGTRRRDLYGRGVLVTFVAALQGSALGALMTLSTKPWYPSHVHAPGTTTGLSPLEDQQVAGVIMWGPCGAIYALAAVLLFAAWIRHAEPGTSARVEAGAGSPVDVRGEGSLRR